VSFNYEIFPDSTCPALNSANCGGSPTGGIYPNQPDMQLEAGNGTSGSDPLVAAFGTSGSQYGAVPSSTGAGGNGTSVNSPALSPETAPQWIGYWSGTINSTTQGQIVTELDAVDWPATVGISNLTLTYTPTSTVPEPNTMRLIGSGLAALYFMRNKRG